MVRLPFTLDKICAVTTAFFNCHTARTDHMADLYYTNLRTDHMTNLFNTNLRTDPRPHIQLKQSPTFRNHNYVVLFCTRTLQARTVHSYSSCACLPLWLLPAHIPRYVCCEQSQSHTQPPMDLFSHYKSKEVAMLQWCKQQSHLKFNSTLKLVYIMVL